MIAKARTPDHIQSRPAPVRFLRLPDVMSRTGLGKDTIYRLMRAGKFPRAIKITANTAGWIEHEIDGYIAAVVAVILIARGNLPARISR